MYFYLLGNKFVVVVVVFVFSLVMGTKQHVDKKTIKSFESWKYLKPSIHHIKWWMIPNDRVLCAPSSAVLTDGYFQIIPEIIVHLNNVNTWGIEYKCSFFYVWDSCAFELRLDVIYDLDSHQSLNMQIVSTPLRATADSLRQNGSLSLAGSSLFLFPILSTGCFMWTNQFLCHPNFLTSSNCCCLFQHLISN